MALTLHYPFLTNPSLTGHSNLGLASSTPDLSITRATAAWDTDADGYIRQYQSGEARFTGATWAENGLAEFNNALWDTETLVSTTDNALANPLDGAVDAVLVTNDGTAGGHYFSGNSLNPFDDLPAQYISSFYAKAGTAGFVHFLVTGDNQWGQWDLSDGSAGFSANLDVTISNGIDVGDGWYRFFIIHTPTANFDPRVYFLDSAQNSAGPSETSSATGYLYGPMTERAGAATTPRAYFAVTTSATKSNLTGTSTKGLLVEEARTNICLQSEDFGTTWGEQGNTLAVVGNEAVAPDGSTTADLIIDDSGGGGGTVGIGQSGISVSDTTYTFSIFAKKNGLDWIDIRSFAGPAGSDGESYFDLTNGVVGTKDANHDSIGIEDYGNGWYRCWVVVTYASADANVQWIIYVADGDGDRTVDRDGTSSIFLWGASLEVGSFPSSYIATTTASVTRNADVVSGSFTASGPQTLYVHFSGQIGGGHLPLQLDDGTSVDRTYLNATTGTALQCVPRAGSVNQALLNLNSAFDGDVRWVVGLAEDDMIQYADGTASAADTSGTIPDTTTIRLGNGVAQTQSGHIAEIAYWDERLDNDTLSGLSDGTTTLQAAGGGVLERKRRQHYRRQKLRAQGIRYKETWAGTYRGRRS